MPDALRFLLPVALAASLSLTGVALADPAAEAADSPSHPHCGHGHPASAFARALHQVDLTAAQKSQIHELLKAERAATAQEFQALHEQHLAFDRAVPGSAEFQSAQAALVQAEAAAVPARVQQEADLHTRIYAVLTDEQRARLASTLAQTQSEGPAAD